MEDDVCAVASDLDGAGPADAARCARDDDRLSFEEVGGREGGGRGGHVLEEGRR